MIVTLNSARPGLSVWESHFRLLDRAVMDPEWVQGAIKAEKERVDLLGSVDLGRSLRYVLLTFGDHRVWTVAKTRETSRGRVTEAFVETVTSIDPRMGMGRSLSLNSTMMCWQSCNK